MTINRAIELLVEHKRKYGDIAVYFDCPHCKQSFSPGMLAAVAAHITAKPAKPPKPPKL